MDDSDIINSSENDQSLLAPDSDSDQIASSQLSGDKKIVISGSESNQSSPEMIKCRKKNKNRNIILDSSGEDSGSETWPGTNSTNTAEDSNNKLSSDYIKIQERFSSFSEHPCSSTRLLQEKVDLTTDLSENLSPIHNSMSKKSLTTNNYRNVIEVDESDDDGGDSLIILSEEEESPSAEHLPLKKAEGTKATHLSKINDLVTATISLSIKEEKNEGSKTKLLSPNNNFAKRSESLKAEAIEGSETKPLLQSNNYVIRTESLKAEELRLKMLVSEVTKNIDSIKSSLKTANLSMLPDKGVRLHMSLKRDEGKLRELRYQQSTISNEILKLQMSAQNQPIVKVPLPKPFTLPTTATDLNAMGKRAMETHRTQQALTVDAIQGLHNSIKNCPAEDAVVTDPDGLYVTLKPHQKHALAWMLFREHEKPSGGILADDMGLGKTLSMISLILKSMEEDALKEGEEEDEWRSSRHDSLVNGNTLVVCPASLLGQWEGEIRNKVKPGLLDIIVHHGQSRERKPRRISRPDVVITTYAILQRELKSNGAIFGVRWRRIILDEAHQIKNFKSQTALAAFELKGKHRWALTGTPVHNKELDLYALVKFLRCSPFDDLTVWKRWVDNRDAAGIQRLNTITKSLMLRRTKEALQQQGLLTGMKQKNFQTIFTELDRNEQEAYEKLLAYSATLFAQFLHQKAEEKNALNGIPNWNNSHALKNLENPFENHPELAKLHKKMKEVSDIKSHHILVLILRLRQFCVHPALVTAMFDKEEAAADGLEDADGVDIDFIDKFTRMSMDPKAAAVAEEDTSGALSAADPLFSMDRISSKMRKVIEKIEEILLSGDKMVVVSQWVSLLEILQKVLKSKQVKCITLNGKVQVKERPAIVDKFNRKDHGPKVMLLSLTAGGVGLNLIGGNHLLLLDLHWNPQLESQACDRIYRIGQDKDVHIYKFVVNNTIEDRILKLQESKLSMADGVLTGAKHASKLTLDDLKMLFKM